MNILPAIALLLLPPQVGAAEANAVETRTIQAEQPAHVIEIDHPYTFDIESCGPGALRIITDYMGVDFDFNNWEYADQNGDLTTLYVEQENLKKAFPNNYVWPTWDANQIKRSIDGDVPVLTSIDIDGDGQVDHFGVVTGYIGDEWILEDNSLTQETSGWELGLSWVIRDR